MHGHAFESAFDCISTPKLPLPTYTMQTLASLSLAPGPDAVPKALAWLESIASQQHWHKRTTFKQLL